MNALPACLLASLLTLSAAACQRVDTPATDDSDPPATQTGEAGSPPAASAGEIPGAAVARQPALADSPTPPVVDGAKITYRCGGGELHVRYTGGRAHVTLPDGRSLALTLNEGLRRPGGGEVFSGESIALRRSGNVVELDQPGQGPQVCTESSATA